LLRKSYLENLEERGCNVSFPICFKIEGIETFYSKHKNFDAKPDFINSKDVFKADIWDDSILN